MSRHSQHEPLTYIGLKWRVALVALVVLILLSMGNVKQDALLDLAPFIGIGAIAAVFIWFVIRK
jgi:hypothetical protein